MSVDPFRHGTPAGDHHSWVRPASAPCPNCECCSKRLCEIAAEKQAAGDPFYACHLIGGTSDHDLSRCPCWRRLGADAAEIPECICTDSNLPARKDCPHCYPAGAV